MNDRQFQNECLARLRRDQARGASQLARQALEDLADFAEGCEAGDGTTLKRRVTDLANALETVRPSMAPIAGLIDRWRRRIENDPPSSLGDLRGHFSRIARDLAATSRRAVDAVAEETASLIPRAAKIVTLSRSSTVFAVFERLAGRGVSVIVSESRPLFEGHRLAEELDQLGIETELTTEAQLGTLVNDADIALVGADAVLVDGSVVNKAGTRLLALAAREADVPFWVCYESFKRSHLSAAEFPLEEADAEQLDAPPLHLGRIRNLSFDVTPAPLVTRWIDEQGSTLGGPR